MKKVLVFGTFDILHPGHLNFLKQAKEYGDYLVVVVGRDETVKKVKDRYPRHSEKERLQNIKKVNLVNEAKLGYLDDPYKIIRKFKPDVICLGYDQTFFVKDLKKKLKEFDMNTKVVRLKPYQPERYKSSLLK